MPEGFKRLQYLALQARKDDSFVPLPWTQDEWWSNGVSDVDILGNTVGMPADFQGKCQTLYGDHIIIVVYYIDKVINVNVICVRM